MRQTLIGREELNKTFTVHATASFFGVISYEICVTIHKIRANGVHLVWYMQMVLIIIPVASSMRDNLFVNAVFSAFKLRINGTYPHACEVVLVNEDCILCLGCYVEVT